MSQASKTPAKATAKAVPVAKAETTTKAPAKAANETVEVNTPFYDLAESRDRKAGEKITVTAERAAELRAKKVVL